MKHLVKDAAKSSTVVVVILAMMIAVGLIVYFDPGPDPNGPTSCAAGEIKLLAQREWYCVTARKP